MKFKDLTPKHVAEIKRLHNAGYGERNISKRIGVGRHAVTKIVSPQTIVRKQAREAEARRHRPDRVWPRTIAPLAVIEERNRALSLDPTPNMLILGDPPPSRSALWGRR